MALETGECLMQDIYGRVGKVHTQILHCSMYLMHLTPDLQEGGRLHEEKVENENEKDRRKLHKRILSAFLVYILLTGLFFIDCKYGEVSATSGLVDETIDAGNLYSQYRWDNYQIDFYVDTSWDCNFPGWMNRIDNKFHPFLWNQ